MCFEILLVFACMPTLRVETGCWKNHIRHCDKCDLHNVQDEKQVLFGNLQNNLLILQTGFTLMTQALLQHQC